MLQKLDPQSLLARVTARVKAMTETDPELRALQPDAEVIQRLQDPRLSLQQIVDTALSGYAGRPALGTRDYKIVVDEDTGEQVRHYLPAYRTRSYAELKNQIEAIANFWRHSPAHRVAPGEMVAFLAFTGAEMTAVDLAGLYANAIVVPLQANAPARDVDEILGDTAPVTMVASLENLALATGYVLKHESFHSLIVIDADLRADAERRAVEEARARLAAAGARVALVTFDEAVHEGGKYEFEPLPRLNAGRDNLMMIMYTSGSTGTPKGAMVHEAILVNTWTFMRAGGPAVTFTYAPLNHFMGRNALYATLAQGGTSYFTLRSDLSTLLEDIRLARPTTLGLIPRICELVYQHYQSEVQRRVANGEEAGAADQAVRAEMSRTFLGDRLTFCSVGSAPTAPELRQFLSECFDIPVVDGYSSTETGGSGITFNNRILRSSVLDYKLLDVPELGYYGSDQPFPRGELLVKTKHMIKGYYKRPEASAAIFDPDGFLKTGDIVEQRGPDHIVWLDRRNNVLKLAQGEFVAIGPLESVYLGHGGLISQIYLYGNAQRAFLLAVVVPDLAFARGVLGHEPSDAELRQLVLEDMREAARKVELRSFEIPRDVLIEREPFSIGNGLLSGVRKPLRPNLKQHYGAALEAIYREMERQQAEEVELLRHGDSSQTARERVAAAFKINIGLGELEPGNPQSYTELGGDSLGAVNLSMLLEEMFGVAVPVSSILHPAASATRLAAQIDALLASSGATARYGVIHADPAQVTASDLKLDALFGEDFLRTAAGAAGAASAIRTVLLTGANGFLGRFLCVEWLEQLAATKGKLICLIRGRDAAEGRQRIEEAIGTADSVLAERFHALARTHLEVIAADLAAPQLGLDEAVFARLASEVDHIVHPAALVNHRLAYRNLFEPNVMGTAELVRLALTKRLKGFDYISSIAVVHMNPLLAQAGEDADIREKAPSLTITGDHYALGYGASKWAGEVILREAHEQFGLPVNVFRADMILPHEHYKAQFNAADTFARLLASVVLTGIAPKSFYQLGPDGKRQSAHYDGLPVNFVAAAMQQLGARNDDGFHSYNFINAHHDDGISLDTIVDWIVSAGYGVARIDGHGEWLRRFEEKLRNLPDEQRQHSSLPVLGNVRAPRPIGSLNTSSVRFQEAVRNIAAGPGIPHLSEAYIHKILRDMQLLALIKPPELVEV